MKQKRKPEGKERQQEIPQIRNRESPLRPYLYQFLVRTLFKSTCWFAMDHLQEKYTTCKLPGLSLHVYPCWLFRHVNISTHVEINFNYFEQRMIGGGHPHQADLQSLVNCKLVATQEKKKRKGTNKCLRSTQQRSRSSQINELDAWHTPHLIIFLFIHFYSWYGGRTGQASMIYRPVTPLSGVEYECGLRFLELESNPGTRIPLLYSPIRFM